MQTKVSDLRTVPGPQEATDPVVTIVVATYDRAIVLSRALRTLIAQTETRWKALVIGDACTDESGERIAALNDPRIRFVNLPQRFGEQAGPNSVGMAIAETPYVAFLNHDDLWFPDHLSLAIRHLERNDDDLYWSRAAFFSNRGCWNDRAFFFEVSPAGRALNQVHQGKVFFCEPLSSWVAHRGALDRLGPMTLASQTALPPITEYCMRAARAGLSLHAADDITVLKDRMWSPPPSYANTAEYAERWVRMFETGRTDEVAEEIERDIWLSTSLGLDRDFSAPGPGNNPSSAAAIHDATGINLLELHLEARSSPNDLLSATLKRRTGQVVSRQPNLADMIEYAKAAVHDLA